MLRRDGLIRPFAERCQQRVEMPCRHPSALRQAGDVRLLEEVAQLLLCGEKVKEEIIQVFYDGIRHKLGTPFANLKVDVLAVKDLDPVRGISASCNAIRCGPPERRLITSPGETSSTFPAFIALGEFVIR